jgi:hypothetical protein
MKVEIKMELGNDAFRTKSHVARALRSLARQIELELDLGDKRIGANQFTILDLNGNKVGTFELREA